uniref:GP129 n=1 Tax=Caviid herpesvirus 2 str. CIDMTR TaxID=1415526 RepID=U6HA05_9BETA|nr:GP129 [Caviid herpesvirus 2 str. CIDMTR]
MRVIVLLAMFCCTRPGMFDDPCCIYSSRDRLVQDFTTSNDTWRLIRCKDNLIAKRYTDSFCEFSLEENLFDSLALNVSRQELHTLAPECKFGPVEVGINKQVKCIRYPRMPKVPSKPEKPSILGVTYRVDYTVMIPTPHFPRDFNGLLCTFLEKNDTFYNTTVDVCGSEFYSVDGNGK